MTEFDVLGRSAATMEAQRAALDVYAQNVASADARGPGGTFSTLVPQLRLDTAGNLVFTGTRRVGITPRYVYAPQDPFAIQHGAHRGYVARSSIDVLTEMVAALDAGRAYEAGASLFDLGKRLAERAIDVGRS